MHSFLKSSAMGALVAATALIGSNVAASAFSSHHHAPYGANTVGRGIAGQHDRLAGSTTTAHPNHFGDAPYGASTMGRGIAGYHGRHH